MMEINFEKLGIIDPLLKALKDMGYENPTKVQEKAIPRVLLGKDMIVLSKTGSGKTAAFGIPMLQMINSEEKDPQGLIITPTRELAVQVEKDIREMGAYLPHKTTSVYGQHNINTEIQALKNGVSIIVGTPGRVFDHITRKTLKTDNIKFLVLDEADRMLDMGFIDQVQQIVRKISKDRTTMLFSATVPEEINKICRKYLKDPETITIESDTKTVDAIEQIYYRVNHDEKRRQLDRILTIERPEGCIIFCNTKRAVDKVHNFLLRKGFAAQALHGDIAQGRRLSIINTFKAGDFPIMVATDVAARGIHIEDLNLVINYDLPIDKDSYVHRIGRTGRAGHSGKAISLVTAEDIMSLYEIEEHTGAMITEKDLPEDKVYYSNKAAAEKWKDSKKIKPKIVAKGRIPKPQTISVQTKQVRPKESQPKKAEFKKVINKENPIQKKQPEQNKVINDLQPKAEIKPIKPEEKKSIVKKIFGKIFK